MNNWKQHLTMPKVFSIILICVSVLIAVASIGEMQHNYVLKKQLSDRRLKNKRMEIENSNLELQQAYYKTDEFLELEARAKLNKAMPGEHLVLLPKNENNEVKSTIETMAPQIDTRTNLQKWAQFLLGVKYD